jgi:SH3-like domain-containing protein
MTAWRMKWARILGAAALAFAASAAHAIDYRSVAVNAAILYDAPSTEARKTFLLSRYYPVEIIVALEKWVKVRDATGALAWVALKDLSDKRTVLVTAPVADVRQSPSPTAPLVFQAAKDVALELIEFDTGGWVKVRHRDGQTGYIQVSQVWGL